jgi:hypothetical protein
MSTQRPIVFCKWAGAPPNSKRTYTGQYSRIFHTETEALEFIRDLWGKTLTAQVNPAKPTKSLVFNSEIQNLIRARPSRTFEQMNCQNPDELTRYWFTSFLQLFVILAAAGFLLSVWVHVGAILGHAVAPSPRSIPSVRNAEDSSHS